MFEITYSDGEKTWSARGNWEDLPSDRVQVVDYIQMDGLRVRLTGFDSYYLAGLLWGGTYEEKGIWAVDGWCYELRPGLPARIVRATGDIPAGALVKRGSLIPDALARTIGMKADWRPYYDARKAALAAQA